MRKLIVTGALFLALLSIAANNLRAEWDVHRYSGLNSDTQSKLKQLKENGDLPGIIALWETTADPQNEGSINNAFQDALVSFPRETFIPVLEEGMKSKQQAVARWCRNTLLQFRDQKAFDFYLSTIPIQPLTADEERRANELIEKLKNGDKEKQREVGNEWAAMGRGVIRLLFPLIKGPDEEMAIVANGVISGLSLSDRMGLGYMLYIEDMRPSPVERMFPGEKDKFLSIMRDILKNEPYNYDAVQLAVTVLANDGTPDDIELIRPYLHGDNDYYAITALGKMKDTKSIPALMEMLAEGHKRCFHVEHSLGICYVRIIADALGQMGDKSVVESLEKALAAENKLEDKPNEYFIKTARERIIRALALCGEKKYLYDLIDKTDPEKFPVDLCGPDEIDMVLERLPKVKDPDTSFRMVSWLSRYITDPDEKFIVTLRDIRNELPAQQHFSFFDSQEIISRYLLRHGDAKEKDKIIAQAKGENAYARAHAISLLLSAKDSESLLPLFIEACDDTGEYIPPLSGSGTKTQVRQSAIMAVQVISQEPFYLWDFDRDRQVKEIKAWYAKYTGQNVAEEKQGRTDNSGGFLMKKIYIALLAIFLCGAAIVVYVYLAGADKRAVAKTMENVRTGVKNSDSNLVLAQVSKDYNYDGYSYAALQVAIPSVFLHMKPSEVTFSDMEITVDGKKAHAKFHFSIKHSVKEVMGVTLEAEITTAGDAEVNLVKESDGWKIIEASARDMTGSKLTLRF